MYINRIGDWSYVWADGALSLDSHFFREGELQKNMFSDTLFFKSNSSSPKGSQLNLLLSLSHEADRARSTRSWKFISDQNRSVGVGSYEVMRPNAAAVWKIWLKKSTEPAAVRSEFVSLRYGQRLLITQGEIPNKKPRTCIWQRLSPHLLVRVAIGMNLATTQVAFFNILANRELFCGTWAKTATARLGTIQQTIDLRQPPQNTCDPTMGNFQTSNMLERHRANTHQQIHTHTHIHHP